jgi:CheY-like chemotaxis protein
MVNISNSILLIEDDQFKQELVEAAIRDARPQALINVGRSVRQAVQLIRAGSYDVIVLDIALPSHESRPGGAQPISQPSGGLEVLLELSYEQRNDPVVIVTQYPEIEFDGRLYPLAKIKQAFGRSISVNIVDVIYFSAQDVEWRERIKGAFR